MRRPDWLASLSLGLLACSFVACAAEFEKYDQERSPRGSLGEEVYKTLCRRVAGTEMPNDLTGVQSQQICLGDAASVQQAADAEREAMPKRLIALADRRALLVQAVDDMLPGELSDEFEHMFRLLLPFYDPPNEDIQNSTRELAYFMQRIAADPNALAGVARVLRDGMTSHEGALGLFRGGFGGAHMRDMARSVLGAVLASPQPDPVLQAHYDTLLSGLALELATTELDEGPDSDTERTKRLLMRTHPDFASGKPLHVSVRDARGLPTPARAAGEPLPFPFVDGNQDGLADADGPVLLTAPEYGKPAPEPFAALGEGAVARDAFGRAQALLPGGGSDPARLLYETKDADQTLLAGLLRVARAFFKSEQLIVQLGAVASAIVGEHAPTSEPYGSFTFAYSAPNPAASPLLDLVHGSTALVDRAISDDSLVLTKKLIEEQEPALATSLEPLLTLERRTRPGPGDAYPAAKLKQDHTFWDEMLTYVERVSRQRLSKDGDTLLEAMLRASLGYGRNLQKPGAPIEQIVDPELLSHQGDILAVMARYKDEWRANPKGESKRGADEPAVIGGFRTPVDRSMPDTPVTCGSDGCGGLIAGTPFERWKQPSQNCMFQRERRSPMGVNCGAPANQSLLQRSLGLIAEMAGRSQCNKATSVRDLLTYAAANPCTGSILPDSPECATALRAQNEERDRNAADAEEAVRNDYTCPDRPDAPCRAYADRYPAAFIDPDGPSGSLPSAIQACHLIDLPDVGRAFGKVVIHEFQFEFPNPWVRRYLEDVARAGDHEDDSTELPACSEDFEIVDPKVAPPCTPEAAQLSRALYENNPDEAARIKKVDNLGDLIEFLLDTTKLFKTEQDTLELRPDAKELTRVLFAAASGDTSANFAVFDPLLLRGSPAACEVASGLPACSDDDTVVDPPGSCCIKNTLKPPFRYRLDTYYGATSFAWEQPIRLTNGKTISFLDAMVSVSDAVDRYGYDETRGDDPNAFEDTKDVVSEIGKVIADHYDSEMNDKVQSDNPNWINYRHKTGLVTYEKLLADAFDDGMMDLTQPGPDGQPLFQPGEAFKAEEQLGLFYKSMPMLQVLLGMSFDSGRDGIDVSAELAEQLLNPHARCAGVSGDRRVLGGQGACDHALAGEPGFDAPFSYRDGRNYICWSDGKCFQGPPRRYASPAYVMIDAIGSMQRKVRADPERDHALRGVVSGVLDTFLGIEGARFRDRRARALLLAMLDDERERLAEERTKGTIATFGKRTDEDAAELLHDAVIGGGIGVLTGLSGKGAVIGDPDKDRPLIDLSRFAASTLSDDDAQSNMRPLLAGLFDMVQLAPGDQQTNTALRAVGSMFAADVDKAIAGQPVMLAPRNSAVGRNLFMLEKTAEKDPAEMSTFERVMQNLSRAPAGRASPLEVIYELAVAIDRDVPGAEGTPSAKDLGLTIDRVVEVLLDKKRGFERLYELVLCTRHPEAAACD